MIRPAAAALAAALLLGAAGPARADVQATSTFGYDGAYVPWTVTPLRVEVASTEKTPVTCTLEALPPRNMVTVAGGSVVYTAEVYLPPGAKKRVTIPVLARGAGAAEGWRLRIRTDRRTQIRHGTEYTLGRELEVQAGSRGAGPASLQEQDPGFPILGVLGDPGGRTLWLGEPRKEEGAEGNPRPVRKGGRTVRSPALVSVAIPKVLVVSPGAGPDTWLCYEGFDALLWVDPTPASLPDDAQVEAVLRWVSCGGRLLVALTPDSRLAASSPLAAAIPAEVEGYEELPPGDLLAALLGPGTSPLEGARTPVARLGGIRGRVTAALPDGRPLAVAVERGLGSVTALAFDPRGLKGASDADRDGLCRMLLGTAALSDSLPGYGSPAAAVRLDPILGHLRKRFLKAPPLALLVLGLLLYVLAIGPLDYYLLKKRNRLRRTVFTFPAIVVGFTLLAYGGSFLLFGGSSGTVRVAWIDFGTAAAKDADVVRGVDLVGTYSPVGGTVETSYRAERSFVEGPWLGSGAGVFFGSDASSLDATIAYGSDGVPRATVSLPLRSHRTTEGRFSAEIPEGLYAAVKGRGAHRTVEVRNGLRCRVRDMVLVYDGRILELGDLEPGARVGAALAPPRSGALPARWPGDGRESRLLPRPFDREGGLFTSGMSNPWGRGSEDASFAPVDESEAAAEAARVALGRAGVGASLGWLSGGSGALAAYAPCRVLARQGIDLSSQVAEGRPLLAGWCDRDPLGTLPAEGNIRSTVVVVRRLLPALEEGN